MLFSTVIISQGSVATYARCDEIFKDHFIANFLGSEKVKQYWKSVNIWWSLGQKTCWRTFLTHSVVDVNYKILN